MKILVTTGNWNAPWVIMESLAKQGQQVYLLDHDPYCAGFRSRYCHGGILCPPERDAAAYVDAIAKIIQSQKFDLLIPASDFSTEVLSAARERIVPFTPMFLPSKALIELARDKKSTYRFALDQGIAIPQTFFPQSLGDVTAFAQGPVFPCVAKKSRGTANKGNTYFSDRAGLLRYYERLKDGDEWPVIQQYIEGDFYGFLGVAVDGEIADCLMYRACTDRQPIGGTPAYCCSVVDQDFLDTARRIVKILNWTGAINLDFIQDRAGRFLLLEINPRLSGSLTFAYSLGIDLPSLYLGLACGQAAPTFNGVHYRPGVNFRYVLSTEIMELLRRKRGPWQFWGGFFKVRTKTDIPWLDPALLVQRLKHLWWYGQDMAKGRTQ